jgi:hypothetical protein
VQPVTPVFYAVFALLLLTHVYREWEYLVGAPGAFCANLPLFVFNTIRLLGLVAAVVLSVLQS